MKENNRYNLNKKIALVLGFVTATSVLSGDFVQAANLSNIQERNIVEVKIDNSEKYFKSLPKINDAKLSLNTSKLNADNKLKISDKLRVEVENSDGKFDKTLINSVTQNDIKDNYETVYLAGNHDGAIIPYREFTVGDKIKLFAGASGKTFIAEYTVIGEKSQDPIVEVTKDKIMVSSKMQGSISLYHYGKTQHNLISFNKTKNDKAISYNFSI